jgi:hypothetical protein
MSDLNLPDTQTVVKTAATYARDLAERVVWTFLAASAAVAIAAGPADVLHANFWQTVGTAGVAAVVSLVKGLAARLVGVKNSASSVADV